MMNVKSAIVLMFELAPKLGKEEAAIRQGHCHNRS